MGYILLISEKPSAAKKIAECLAEGEVKEMKKDGATFYKIRRGGEEIVIAPAAGHLFVLTEKRTPTTGWTYPVFDIEWVPIFQANKTNTWSKKYFDNFNSLVKDADSLISATDYDIEGSVIAYNIIRFIYKKNAAKRMKFSTLTKQDLVEAYENASPTLDFPQIEAGLARHFLDYFWGINVSRALTLALRAGGGYKTLSTGRVQGPTLELLKKKQEEIQAFKPTPFWEIYAKLEKRGSAESGKSEQNQFTAKHAEDKFWDKTKAEEIFKKIKAAKDALILSADKKESKLKPPTPFDLTTMQREAYNLFGFSPKQTLDIAQTLYEMGAISYPRTSSQKLPAKIGYLEIIRKLSKKLIYSELCEKLLKKPNLKPNEGPKEDPAHPSIFPTVDIPSIKELSSQQAKIYDLIVKRFLSVFADPAIREYLTVKLDANNEIFVATGVRTIEANWIDFYRPYAKFKEQLLPPMAKGDVVDVKKIELLEKETQPPTRFTQASILKELEDLGLGTKATRALILQTLYDRGYIKEKSIIVTKLGEVVASSLEKYCPDIVSVDLTRGFEEGMESIQQEKKKKEELIESAQQTLTKTLNNFKKNEKIIGSELIEGIREVMREESTVGKCKCSGDLVIRMSKAKKRFIGCTGYPNCTETFSLPHKGTLTMSPNNCGKCGLKIVQVKNFKKKPWRLCVRCGFVTGKKKDENKSEPPENKGGSGKIENSASKESENHPAEIAKKKVRKKKTSHAGKSEKALKVNNNVI